MSLESDLIQAINETPGDRTPQLIYADWLDDMGDPRGEAWRVLIEEGRRPTLWYDRLWNWFQTEWNGKNACLSPGLIAAYPYVYYNESETFHAAMDAAAIAWVRHHRDPDFLRPETERVEG